MGSHLLADPQTCIELAGVDALPNMHHTITSYIWHKNYLFRLFRHFHSPHISHFMCSKTIKNHCQQTEFDNILLRIIISRIHQFHCNVGQYCVGPALCHCWWVWLCNHLNVSSILGEYWFLEYECGGFAWEGGAREYLTFRALLKSEDWGGSTEETSYAWQSIHQQVLGFSIIFRPFGPVMIG